MNAKIAIVAILFLLFMNFNSVADEIQWKKTYGIDTYNLAYSIQHTGNGYIIAGYTTPSFKDRVNGNADVYVIKIDENGNIQWQRAYGGNAIEGASSIEQTDDGYIIAGWRSPAQNSAVYVIKITSIQANVYPIPSILDLGKHKSGEKFTTHFYLHNAGNKTLKWNITENIPWLDVEPKSGEGEANISVFVNTTSLKEGKYDGYINVITDEDIKNVRVKLEIEKKRTPGFEFGIAILAILLYIMVKRR